MWRTQEGIRRYRKTIKAQTIKMRGVVQLVRASACHAGGRRFEPRRSRQCACEFGLLYVQRCKGNMLSSCAVQ